MKLGFIMMRHPPTRISPIMPKVVSLLQEWGAEVELIYPEEQLLDVSRISVSHDLYVLKSGSELALSLAGVLHAAGATILNPYPVTATCRNKIITAQILHKARIPMPVTYVTVDSSRLSPLLDDTPLVVKPYMGSGGQGVHVVWDADELDDIDTGTGPVFAQRYHQPAGPDRKIYCIGGQVFGVKRIWPARTYEQKLGEPFSISEELREIALRCGRAFGMELYGLDVIMSDGRPYVVDVSAFPGFKGVPDGALRLADYIYAASQRALSGEPILPPAQVAL